MTYRRSTFLIIIFLALTLVTCLSVRLSAAPPQFRTSWTYTSTVFSPFPGFEPKFISSITPYEYVPLQKLIAGNPYDINYDYPDSSVSYTRLIKKDLKMIPVTSDIDKFVNRRVELSMANMSHDIGRQSLLRNQKDKAGGLLNFQIPIPSRAFESIFGEGGAGLKVSGYRKISFTGRSTWTDQVQTAYNKQSKFPVLEMDQVYRFDIEGTIGSKISVKVSQDSRNDIPLANRLILRYKGDEDDVLQTIEAGNTTLNLPATQFLAYNTRVQGLFGIKATAQLADLSITAIASQEKGTTETIEISAGTSAMATRVVRDVDYKKRTAYDLGRLPLVRARSDSFPEPDKYDFLPGDKILKAILYLDNKTADQAEQITKTPAICYIDPNDTLSDDTLSVYRYEGYFDVVDEADYYLYPEQFFVLFTRSVVSSSHVLAVYMEVQRSDGTVDTIGNISTAPFRLKLIKPQQYTNVNHHVWEYEWKNVYYLNTSNIDVRELDVQIYKGAAINNQAVNPDDPYDQEGVKYLQVLGLDQGGNNGKGDGVPDGEIDRNANLVDAALGYLFFPSRHPFDSRIYYSLDAANDTVYLNDSVPEIYLNSSTSIQQTASKYYIAISTQERGTSVINLNATNIIDGSEVIKSGGVRLNRGTDYDIDYDFGRLTLLNDTLDYNSNLSIMFEKAPFFSLAQKTLLGTRLEYAPNREFRIGTTLLYKSDKSTARKPKVGEETSKIFVGDVDFDYRFENPLLTTMADAVPFISATAKSYMQVSAEMARSYPNPNVDGEVFIDDFEGSKDSYQLGIFRHNWRMCSRPATIDTMFSARGQAGWYNPIEEIALTDIWPGRDAVAGEDFANVLNIHFRPTDHKTIVDTIENVIDTSIGIPPENSWAGFMRNISSGGATQIENAQLLELRIKGDTGIMHIDLGRITEDINGNGRLDNEDKNFNLILEDEEDVGLDGRPSIDEVGYDAVTNPDPSGDNWIYNPDNINPWTVNGTEGNRDDPDGGYYPDTEDEDNDGFETVDSYFSYKVDLSQDTGKTSFYVEDSRNDKGWKTIRIPLRDPTAIDTMINDPSWTNIWYARIWFDSAGAEYVNSSNGILIQIASIELMSTTWADSFVVADSLRGDNASFDVAVVNGEINNNYTPPAGVQGYYDQATQVTETEQSLEFSFEGLNGAIPVFSPDSGIVLAADTGLAVRKFFSAMNFMGYAKLQAYVHNGIDTSSTSADSVLFFFRMGYDKSAYYEYRTVLKKTGETRGWSTANHVTIDFNEITGLKAKLLNDRTNGVDSSLVRYDPETKCRVMIKPGGQDPTLTRIQYFSMGVVNLDKDKPASGNVWIDELRLTDVRDDVGTAARFAVSGNMSDLFNYNFGYSFQDAYYRGVSSATKGGASDNLGSGQTKKNYNFSGSMKLERFFPRALELQMPLSFNWTQSVQEPLLRSGTDIIVPEELKNIETSMTVTKGFRVSQRFSKKTKNLLFVLFLNRFSTSFSYNISKGHSPTQPMFLRERHDSKGSFDLGVRKPPSISPLKFLSLFRIPFGIPSTRLYLYPTRLDFSGSLGSSYSRSINQNSSNPTTSKLDFVGSMNSSFKIVESLTGSYNFSTNRDLRDPKTVNLTFNPKKFKLGVEQTYSQAFRASYSPTILKFLTHKFNYSANYGDNFRLVSDTFSYHSVNSRVNADASFTFKHQELIGSNQKQKRGTGLGGKKDKASSPGFNAFGWALRGVRTITDAVKPVSGKIGTSRTLTYPGLADKASMNFRLGLTEDPGVESVSASSATVRKSKSVTKDLSGSSGMDLFAGISVDASYSRNSRETFDATPTKTVSVTWPDLKFNLRQMKGLWYLGKLMNALSPNSRYSRNKSTKMHTNALYPYNITVKESFSPFISFTINPLRSMRSTFRYETSQNTDTKISEATGENTSITKRSDQSFAISWTYSFRSPTGVRLPLLGRLKFESNLSVTLDVNYRKSYGESANSTNSFQFTTTEDKTSITIRPSANYSFSSTVKGGLTARWQDSNDVRTRRKSHTRELGIWVELRF